MTPVRFDARACESLCRSRNVALGSAIHFTEATESTNDDARRALESGARHGEVFVSASQSRGRGRRGAAWFAPSGESLLFSVIVGDKLPKRDWALLPLIAGLAVRGAAASRVTRPVWLKWPNDVLADGKKLAGILVESRLGEHRPPAFAIGIGINVESRAFPPELRHDATSLALLGAETVSFEMLLADILSGLEARLSGQGTPVHHELARYDALCGRAVLVDGQRGVAAGIDEDGALLLQRSGSRVERMLSGSVRLVVDDPTRREPPADPLERAPAGAGPETAGS